MLLGIALASMLAAAPEAAGGDSRLKLHAQVFSSDVQPINVAILGGKQWWFALLQVGLGRDRQFIAGTGFGAHYGGDLWFEATGTVSILQTLKGIQETDLQMGLGGSVGVQLFPRVAIFMGPDLYTQVSFLPNTPLRGSYLNPVWTSFPASGGGGWQFWGGLHAGLRI